jgi:hypothetical protein
MENEEAGFLEKFLFNAFVSQISGYVDMAESGANLISSRSSEDGTVTVKTIIYTIKDKALDKLAPLFITLQILILIAFAIYFFILLHMSKGGLAINNGVVFGDS